MSEYEAHLEKRNWELSEKMSEMISLTDSIWVLHANWVFDNSTARGNRSLSWFPTKPSWEVLFEKMESHVCEEVIAWGKLGIKIDETWKIGDCPPEEYNLNNQLFRWISPNCTITFSIQEVNPCKGFYQ